MKIVVRAAVPSDHPFIYSTYLKNNWFSASNDTTLKKDTWMRIQHGRLEKVLAEEPVKVACFSDDADTILGYQIETYSYIRPQWRRVAGIEELFKETK